MVSRVPIFIELSSHDVQTVQLKPLPPPTQLCARGELCLCICVQFYSGIIRFQRYNIVKIRPTGALIIFSKILGWYTFLFRILNERNLFLLGLIQKQYLSSVFSSGPDRLSSTYRSYSVLQVTRHGGIWEHQTKDWCQTQELLSALSSCWSLKWRSGFSAKINNSNWRGDACLTVRSSTLNLMH